FGGSTESQFAGKTHHLIKGHAGSSDGAPTNLDAPAILGREVAESLRGVERISAVAGELGGFRSEFLAIKSSYHVFAAGGCEDPFLFVGIPVDREFKKVRAFEKAFDAALK